MSLVPVMSSFGFSDSVLTGRFVQRDEFYRREWITSSVRVKAAWIVAIQQAPTLFCENQTKGFLYWAMLLLAALCELGWCTR